ncbi:MAG: putative porin [Bacteroidaceae bacterium]|nr:putative porin [Bacteroidaceae bacterium]
MTRTTSRILFFVLSALSVSTVSAQRIIGELESNAGYDGYNVADSMRRQDAADEDKKKKKVVPVDVRSWTIDPIYGHRTEVDVDTLHHLFQNDDHSEGREGQYNTLSNLGSPRLNRLYMERASEPDFIFTAPFDQFITTADQFRYFNTKSPYMNLTYTWSGDKKTGHDRFRALYANNVGKRFNFGGMFDYFYGQGNYDHQSTSFMNATGFASYTGERYDLHFHYTHNYMKWGENGGIEDDGYITNPEDQPQSYESNEIPVRLTETWNRMENDEVFLNHRYHVGFMRVDSDSIRTWETFVPVTTFFHTVHIGKYSKAYIEQNNPVGTYHTYDFLPNLAESNDRYKFLQIYTAAGVSLREGFNRYAVAGLNAFVGYRYRRYNTPDYATVGTTTDELRTFPTEGDIMVGGQLIRTQGRLLHYNLSADFVVAGTNIGEFNVDGRGELNIPLLGDTAQVAVNLMASHAIPSYYLEHYHSKHAWWDHTFEKVLRTRLGATVTLPHTRTVLSFAIENLKNYAWLADEGIDVTTSGTTWRTHNVVCHQTALPIQVLSASLRQNLKFGPVHLDNVITWQNSTQKDILPLPALNTYSNLYLAFIVAKVMKCEVGGDMTFFTRYYAPDYSPVFGMYTTQNAAHRLRIGGYPLISVYANILLKKCRFYVQYYHVNQGAGNSFWAPHYPMNPSGLRFGISWNFYD